MHSSHYKKSAELALIAATFMLKHARWFGVYLFIFLFLSRLRRQAFILIVKCVYCIIIFLGACIMHKIGCFRVPESMLVDLTHDIIFKLVKFTAFFPF